MPMITIQVAREPDTGLARDIAETVSSLTARLLGKDPAVTSIAVDFVAPRLWFVGGKSAQEHAKSVFFVDTRITDGTNTKDEKARYIAETFAAMRRLLGDVHEESYVHVHDARADAYGYGGLTQERRYVAGRPAPAPESR
jgi:4-oxalocrotonate tautomerase